MRRRVLVVDDHPGFRAAARRLLDCEAFEIVGEAPTGEAALQAAERMQPDLILLDVQLPGMSGFDVADLLAGTRPSPMIVLVSNRPEAAYRRRLRGAQAAGFIAKSELTREAVEALAS